MYMTHGITASACEITVARAAPLVPRPNFMMNRRSRQTFVTAEQRRNISGILLLPMALIKDEHRLYMTVKTMPKQIVVMYSYA